MLTATHNVCQMACYRHVAPRFSAVSTLGGRPIADGIGVKRPAVGPLALDQEMTSSS